ncbi:MAG: SUMF1/EgtB/PvdO family nonheme iron enzyme, partial [Acidobacteriaceae bacterium]|nr:SUMF1/EgtB/PvdO family nonheme iron enzyme [Acidobacteriaceae bacterium]
RHMANIWQGIFPHENLVADGYACTSPVKAFPANGYGVFDMIGNVWEWTTDWCSARHTADATKCLLHSRRTHEVGVRLTVMTDATRRREFRARSSRAARISAPRITAAAIVRQPATPSRLIRA